MTVFQHEKQIIQSTDIKEPILSRHAIDLFVVFSTFDMDKLRKNR